MKRTISVFSLNLPFSFTTALVLYLYLERLNWPAWVDGAYWAIWVFWWVVVYDDRRRSDAQDVPGFGNRSDEDLASRQVCQPKPPEF